MMNSILDDVLPASKELTELQAYYKQHLSQVAQDKNRLRAFYELVILAQCSLEIASSIDFTNFLSGMKDELASLNTKTEQCIKDNQEHYKWSSEVRAHVFEESADREEITRIDGEIKQLLHELDRLLSRQVQNNALNTFENALEGSNAK